ncbi:MAG: DUF6448 family protein [Armatimonadota bacterium]
MKIIKNPVTLAAIILIASILVFSPQRVNAHCDTLDGPVVKDAAAALDKGDVSVVLKWIKPSNEAEIKQAFAQTLKVRKLNTDAKKLADNYFYETVVRVHRAGEGAPYTGLKPAGAEIEPGIAAADRSLVTGELKPVITRVNEEISKGITARFNHTLELRKHMNESVVQGRKYVEAYVEYIHYVERLVNDASGKTSAHTETTVHEEAH